MRYMEFADAEAQLGLLRTIIDNTWAAIAKQAEDQKKAEALRAAQEKAKPRQKRSSVAAPIQPLPPQKPIAPLKTKRPKAQTDAAPTKAELLQPQRPIPPKKPIGVNNRAKDSRSSA